MKIIQINILLILFIILISCVKDISLELPQAQEKLVIEAMIDYNDYPMVFITKNTSYFTYIDTTILNSSIIKNSDACVIVSNGIISDTLEPAIMDRYPYHGYRGTKFKGEINKSYVLKILYLENEYNSTTTIPEPIPIDSVWFSLIPGHDSLGFLNFKFTDPPIYGNYYTFYSKILGKQKWYYRPSFGPHVLDDKLINNQEFTYTPMTKGYERNAYYFDVWTDEDLDFLDLICYKIGDTVSLKMSTIDQSSFNFWSSVYRNVITGSNPFTNPASVKSNIYGSPANGYWIGSGTYFTNVYIADSANLTVLP
ncbi:MAG: DUF4249 domain-containing protein [Bacteroidales bacterium]|nr:DUF4249 domain-containing protein [Bacteroidales bacterium]MCK9499561.1 DUF4249 domain-containing protein [Bacteroidales bacterium]MDY0315051.1 DUF4249 family protein [Bacteroidales bacterium]